jgi:hypothetical protein
MCFSYGTVAGMLTCGVSSLIRAGLEGGGARRILRAATTGKR